MSETGATPEQIAAYEREDQLIAAVSDAVFMSSPRGTPGPRSIIALLRQKGVIPPAGAVVLTAEEAAQIRRALEDEARAHGLAADAYDSDAETTRRDELWALAEKLGGTSGDSGTDGEVAE